LKIDGLDSPGQWSGQSWVTVVSSSTYSEVEFDRLSSETERVLSSHNSIKCGIGTARWEVSKVQLV